MAATRNRAPDPRRGVYLPVLPLDVLILKMMPAEGTMFMGVYPEGPTVADMRKVIGGGKLPSSLFGTRMRVLNQFGYAVPVVIPRQATKGWQITTKGKALVKEHDPPTEPRPGPEQEVHDGPH